MNSKRDPPPYPGPLTVALFGKRVQLKNTIGKFILSSASAFDEISNTFVLEMNEAFKIINTPDFFEEDCLYPDQMIIDFMAHSVPGPDLFILAVDSENSEEEKVAAQIIKLQETFGENITKHLVIMLQDIESFHLLGHLRQRFNSRLATANENLASECKKWCSGHPSFQYDYKDYSKDVVMRRKAALEKRRYDGYLLYHHGREGANPMTPSTSQDSFAAVAPEHHIGKSPCDTLDNTFNIVLLGKSGTGKSASANTIMTAGKLDSRYLFRSEASSMPITRKCQVQILSKPFWREVRLVDTPDFFDEQVSDSQEQLEECKRYCQAGRCVVLLVFQLGRFTDDEKEILQKLEDKLGWKIRERTVILLTHGEDLKGDLQEYIETQDSLKNIVEQCSNRCHLFKNKSKNSKQVIELIEKLPGYKDIFSMFAKNKNGDCCVL